MSNKVNRPSQKHLKWINVKDSKGNVVRKENIAYKPAPWEKKGKAPAVRVISRNDPEKNEEVAGGIDNITDDGMRELFAKHGGGDAAKGWNTMVSEIDEDFDSAFSGDYGSPSRFDMRNATRGSDPLHTVATAVVHDLTYLDRRDGRFTGDDQEVSDMARELISAGLFKNTKIGQAVDMADGIVNYKAAQEYAKRNNLTFSRTPDQDYMGNPSWAGSESGGFDEKATADKIRGHLKAMRDEGILNGRASVQKAKYSSRTITIKQPGYDSLSHVQKGIVTSQVQNNISPVIAAFDYDRGNSQYDYFNSMTTSIRVTE